jgi:ABC-type oligopeptide transport system substrate-binding subunit
MELSGDFMKVKAIFVLSILASGNCFAAAPQCSTSAISQAKKLLSYHTDGDDRAEVESQAKQLPSLANPVNKNQKFIVLEVMGYVYKGNYRMRFIYYPMGRNCVLMGQEILELSTL